MKYDRDGPAEDVREERVIDVLFDGHRSAKVALIGHGDKLRYIIATENMKPGDLIRSSKHIPRNPGKFRKSPHFNRYLCFQNIFNSFS